MSDGEGAAKAAANVPNPWRVFWTALPVLCGVCLLGAAVGFFRTPRTYRSTALVARTPPPGIPPGAALGNPPYWASQARLAVSRRVVDRAMAGPDWPAAWPRGPEAGAAYAKGLSAQVQPGGGFWIAYEGPDPAAAPGRLAAFVNAYRAIAREDEASFHAKRVQLLSELLGQTRQEQEKQAVASRLASVKASPPGDPMRLVLPAGPAALVPARHWRDAAWSAAIAGALFALVRGPHLWRAWRAARVIAAARTAFPVVQVPAGPRPVVPIEDDTGPTGTTAT